VPLLGQDTRTVLTDVLGMGEQEIDALIDAGVVRVAEPSNKASVAS
jgi:hypothetical protein